jgi:hypothetical protein
MEGKVRAISLIQWMFSEYNLKIKDTPLYIFKKFIDENPDEIEKEKRKPINGVLPLTNEELGEFSDLFYEFIFLDSIEMDKDWDRLIAVWIDSEKDIVKDAIVNYKAILWLADRFQLEME